MIPIVKEPDDMAENCFGIYERCVFCDQPSIFWHERTNNCVCPLCAKEHKVSELTNWRKGKKK